MDTREAHTNLEEYVWDNNSVHQIDISPRRVARVYLAYKYSRLCCHNNIPRQQNNKNLFNRRIKPNNVGENLNFSFRSSQNILQAF